MISETQSSNDISYLSTSVKFILVDSRPNLTSSALANFVTPCLTFDWGCISCHLGSWQDVEFLEKNSETLWPKLWSVFIDCGSKLRECRSPPTHFWQWTNCPEEIWYCYNQLQGEVSPIINIKCVLLLTSIFENAVGNVFQRENFNVPFLLKDLLASRELLVTFGKFPIFLARSLAGTPLAFNIRNVCWHGFPAPEEIHSDIAAALVVLITSFGKVLYSSQITGFPVRPRVDATIWNSFLPAIKSTGFPNLAEYCDDVKEVIRKSPFIPQTHLSYWTHAFDLLRSEKHGECLLLLMPALEHTLRFAFGSVHCCPNRVFVAEQHTLYTTLDEILDQYFIKSEEVQEENQLVPLLGEKIMEMLMDILHNHGGPRLRDKLSHGECDIQQIPSVVSNHMFCIALLVLFRLKPTQTSELGKVLKSTEERYIPQFHSISILKSQTLAVLEKIRATSLFGSKMFESRKSQVSDDLLKLKCTLLSISESLTNCTGDIVEHIYFFLKMAAKTLYRSKSDMIVVGSFRKIISALDKSCENCAKTLHDRQQSFEQHVLRSRQRAAFVRFLDFIPSFKIASQCIVFMVLIQLHSLPDTFLNQKLLRHLLYYSENLASLSSQEKNRWVEIEEKTIDFCQQFIPALTLFHQEDNML